MIKTRIILNGNDVDLISDVSMPITYQIANVRDPSKKNTNFTKTVTLPSTSVNDVLFGYLWDTNVQVNSSGTTNYTPSFNPNKKASCQILYNGAEIFNGYMKLDRIKVLQDYSIEYEVTCYGKLKDLFLSLGEKTLAEIDLSKYDHPYTRYVQQGSWDSFIFSNGTTTAFSLGEGYVYPMADYAMNNDIDYKVSHFFPALYYKTIVREAINQAGFSFDGAIFDNDDFKSLIVSYGSGQLKLSNTQIDNRTFQASNTSTTYAYSSGTTQSQTVTFNDDTTPPNHDTGLVYNTSNSTFTCSVSGTYKITFYVSVSVTHFPSTASAVFNAGGLGFFEVRKNGLNINSVQLYTHNQNGFNIPSVINVSDTSPITSGATSPTGTGAVITVVTLGAGDTLKCHFRDHYITSQNVYAESPGATSYVRVNIGTASYFTAEIADPTVNEGDTVSMSSVLPSTIKQKDFISSFFKLFNIYTEDDRYNDTLLHFETQPDFYDSSGTTRDWSEKLDFGKDYEVIPMGDLDARTYLYKFKDDGDFWNDYYKKKYNETYGQKKYDIDNDWLSNTNLTEVIFAPTPLVDRQGSDRIIPRIFQLNNNGLAVPKTSNLRLWYYGGVKTTTDTWNYIASSGTTAMNTYPYAGHLDDVQNPTFDVNFYLPIEVFYTATAYTNNNLFNIYYKRFIDQITNKNSKIFKGYFHVTPYDIAILNFRDSFFFRGDYWRLNKIYDYNPVEENRTTLCEFIKLTGGVPFVPTSGTTNGGADVTLDEDFAPTYSERIQHNNNFFGNDAIVKGDNNIVASSAKGVCVFGSDNSIGEGAENISLIATSGTVVLGGVMNVTAVNCSDMTIDQRYSGLTVINNTIHGGKRLLYKTGNYKTTAATDLGAFILFVGASNLTSDLPEPATIYNGWSCEIKCINNAGYYVTMNVTTDYSDSTVYFEDGVSTTFIVNDGESYTFTYRTGIWYIS